MVVVVVGIIINVVFGIEIAVVVVVVNCEGPALSGLILSPVFRIIIGLVIGVSRILYTAVGTVIVIH